MNSPVGSNPLASFESRVADVLGALYVRTCELSGHRNESGLPVDPLVEDLAKQVLERVSL